MNVSQLIQALSMVPADAIVTVARAPLTECDECGSSGFVVTVRIDHYIDSEEVTLEYGTNLT